jgi:hypothetical protein
MIVGRFSEWWKERIELTDVSRTEPGCGLRSLLRVQWRLSKIIVLPSESSRPLTIGRVVLTDVRRNTSVQRKNGSQKLFVHSSLWHRFIKYFDRLACRIRKFEALVYQRSAVAVVLSLRGPGEARREQR